MEIYFLRHGIATLREAGRPDAERPLVPEGIKKTRAAAETLKKLDISFDRIVTSPLVRARQTAEIVARTLGIEDRLQELEELGGHPVPELVRALTRFKRDARLLLVGHQPQMGDTIAYLLGGENKMFVDLKKSGICLIEVGTLPPRSRATLSWMLAPKHLKLMT